jgi:hypothetical protein
MLQFKITATSVTANAEVDQSHEETVKNILGYVQGMPVMPHNLAIAAMKFAAQLNRKQNLGATDWVGSFAFDQQ